MKQKRLEVKTASTKKKQEQVMLEEQMPAVPGPAQPLVDDALTRQDKTELIIFCVLLLFGITVMTTWCSVMLAALAVVSIVGKRPWNNLRVYFCIPVLGLLFYAVMHGAAAIYTPFDHLAMGEYNKFLATISLCVIALARFKKKHVPGLMWVLCAVSGVIALISIDIGGSLVLFTPFNAFTDALGMDYSSVIESSAGSRNNGLYNNANMIGAMMGMATFTGLYLVRTAKTAKQRFVACLLLGFATMSLFLCVSRGAWVCFAVAVVVYLAVARGERVRLLFLMVSVGFSTGVVGGAAMMFMAQGSVIPLLLAFVCGPVIFALDCLLGERATAIALNHKKVAAIGAASAVAACVAFVVVALNLTGPYTFDEETGVMRSVNLPAGEYTLSADWSGAEELCVTIYTRTREEAMMGKETILYRKGPVTEASFALLENDYVYIDIYGTSGLQVKSLTVSDGTEVPLKYTLLPEMISSRIQKALLEDNSLLLRLQYDIDALKIFAQNPLVGKGLVSTEGWGTAVQPFFYESKFAHNHVLQVMSETGLLGLAGFLAFLVGGAWLLLHRLRRQADQMAATLLAVWVMINLHSLMEINLSIRPTQCLAFLFTLLAVLAYAEPLSVLAKDRGSRKKLEICGCIMAGCFCVYTATFGALVQVHQVVQDKVETFATDDRAEYLDTIEKYMGLDVFQQEELKLSYISQAIHMDEGAYWEKMNGYVQSLHRYNTFTSMTGLAQYYYFPLGNFEQAFACSRAGIAQKASDSKAWNQQVRFYKNSVWPVISADNVDAYMDGVLETAAYMEDYNQEHLGQIALIEENQSFVDEVKKVRESGASGEAAFTLLSSLIDG